MKWKRNAYRVLEEKPGDKRPLEIHGSRWNGNI
jgi:hypothetical protein